VKLLEQVETTQRELGSRDQIYAAQAQLTASFGGWWVVMMAYGVWLDNVDSSTALCPLPRLSLPQSTSSQAVCVCALSGRDGSHTAARTATTHVLGGKAKKAKLSALTQYRTDADSIRSSHALTASKVTHETSVASADPDAGRVIPPYDKSATEAANAYPLNKSTSRQRRLPSVSRVRLVFSHPLWLGIPVATAWPIDYATPFVSRDIDTDMVGRGPMAHWTHIHSPPPTRAVITRSELSYLGNAAELFEVPPGSAGLKQIAAWEQDPDYKRTVIAAMRYLHAEAAEVDPVKVQLIAYLDLLIRMLQLMKTLPGVRRGVFRDKVIKKLEVSRGWIHSHLGGMGTGVGCRQGP
jgi:hypothetical protein